jgi:uncharacterized membrane protein YbhN (UPF0104 family)
LIKKERKTILHSLFWLVIFLILFSVGIYLRFRVFDIPVSLTQSFFLASIGNLGLLIALTPANLGISEAIIVFSATTIGITPAHSLSIAILGRVVMMLVLFVQGPILSHYLIRREPEPLDKDGQQGFYTPLD